MTPRWWRRDLAALFPDPVAGYRGTRFALWFALPQPHRSGSDRA